jgi:pSer/pThr/pTyr-binding forkhead associated (FHA) protein
MAGAVKEEKLAIETQSPYGVKRDLYEAATKIKNQLELLQKRMEKMEEHRNQVSDAVYLKVRTDYEIQIDEVKKNFKEKCAEIEKELAKLYQGEREQKEELGKHEEILEEAKFRHTLGEFNEKKFKEVEREENKEIGAYKGILEIIKSSMTQYEEILGRPFSPEAMEDLPEVIEEEEVAKILAAEEDTGFPEHTPPTAAATPSPKTKKAPPAPIPVREDSVTDALVSQRSQSEAQLEAALDEELDSLLQTEGDYFSESSREEKAPPEGIFPEATEKVPVSAKHPQRVSKTQPDDDSISSILQDIPIEEEAIPAEEGTDTGEAEATGAKLKGEIPEASFLLLEGDLDEPEIILGENTTIGRSPTNDLVLKESKISRQHAAVHFRNGHFVLVDLKSSNGVLVNNKRVEEHYLKDGDEVRIGGFKFQFNIL